MHKKVIFTIILGTLLSGCQSKVVPQGPWVQKIDTLEISSTVLSFSAKLGVNCHLFLEDSYVSYDDDIKKICLRYSSQKLLTLCEARLLIVELTEEFLDRLNSGPPLTFECEQFPLTADQLDIRINFESFYGKYCDKQYIGLIWLQAGCVHFFAFDRKDIKLDWDHHRTEPYFKSKELALIKKEADEPYLEKKSVENGVMVGGITKEIVP